MTQLNPLATRRQQRADRAARNQEAAVDAFMAKKAEIDEMLARLQTISDDHFGASPDEIHWGHVGSLDHHAALLKRITDAAFKEGEHAD